VARVLGLATPESILLANFWGEREESNLKESFQGIVRYPLKPVLGTFSDFVRFWAIFVNFWPFPFFTQLGLIQKGRGSPSFSAETPLCPLNSDLHQTRVTEFLLHF
jgi:hypothetical protein